MTKMEVQQSINELKQQINNAQNKNKLVEKKEKLNLLNKLKKQLRSFTLIDNTEITNKRKQIKERKKELTFKKEKMTTTCFQHILKMLYNRYVEYMTNIKVTDIVKCENKQGCVKEFVVQPHRICSNRCGIYVKICHIKKDGTMAKRMIRRSRLDDTGFPLEHTKFIKKLND